MRTTAVTNHLMYWMSEKYTRHLFRFVSPPSLTGQACRPFAQYPGVHPHHVQLNWNGITEWVDNSLAAFKLCVTERHSLLYTENNSPVVYVHVFGWRVVDASTKAPPGSILV